jgi:curved DNA-binding protein CbpA
MLQNLKGKNAAVSATNSQSDKSSNSSSSKGRSIRSSFSSSSSDDSPQQDRRQQPYDTEEREGESEELFHHHHHQQQYSLMNRHIINNESPASFSSLIASAAASKTSSSSSSVVTGTTSSKIPTVHIETILQVFGGGSSSSSSSLEPLNLYRDVLDVSPDATEREIRIAYFRKGREVLSEAGFASPQDKEGPQSPSVLDPATRTKFQAVSMAYEILSTPAWKEAYLQNDGGLVMTSSRVSPTVSLEMSVPSSASNRKKEDLFAVKSSNVTSSSSTTTTKKSRPAPALRESSFRGGRKSLVATSGGTTTSGNASVTSAQKRHSFVRWKEHVEELVFDNHPNEHADSDNDEEEDIIDDSMMAVQNPHRSSPHPTNQQNADSSSRNSTRSPANESNTSTISTTSRSRRNRRTKPKVVIESEELESHLKQMDTEAEKHFVNDFWDNFEESIDGILSLVDSIGSKQQKQQQQGKNRRPPASRGINNKSPQVGIERSLSHDTAEMQNQKKIQLESIVEASSLEGDDVLFQRSKSFPSPTGSSQSLAHAVVSPDNAVGHTAAEPNTAWASFGNETELGPVPVTPTTTHRAKRTFVADNTWQSAMPKPAASANLFRPISPSLTEASDLRSTGDSSARSDPFELESLEMSELENPFRDPSVQAESTTRPVPGEQQHQEQHESMESSNPASSIKSVSQTPTASGKVDISFDSSNTKTAANITKSRKVNISMVTSAQEATNKKKPKTTQNDQRVSNVSKGSSTGDDLFSGLDEAKQRQTQYTLAGKNTASGPVGFNGQDIDLKRTSSATLSECLSDLSESVFQYGVNSAAIGKTATTAADAHHDRESTTGTPASEASTATTLTSNVFPPKRGKARSVGSVSSYGNDPLSAMDGISIDGMSVHSVESAMEATGFFDYFLAYVSAILTECNALSETGQGFSNDILGLFAQESSVNVELREPPARFSTVGSSVTSFS